MSASIESDILSRVIDPANPTFSAEAAKGLLELSYSDADHQRMADLAAKSDEGTLTPAERRELEGYVFVGDVLALLKSKARISLQRRSPAA